MRQRPEAAYRRLRKALEQNRGSIDETAQSVGYSSSELAAVLAEFGLRDYADDLRDDHALEKPKPNPSAEWATYSSFSNDLLRAAAAEFAPSRDAREAVMLKFRETINNSPRRAIKLFHAAIEAYEGNVEEIAEHFGTNRQTLRRWRIHLDENYDAGIAEALQEVAEKTGRAGRRPGAPGANHHTASSEAG